MPRAVLRLHAINQGGGAEGAQRAENVETPWATTTQTMQALHLCEPRDREAAMPS